MTGVSHLLARCAAVALCIPPLQGQDVVTINSERIRLGDPSSPEWEWFENDPPQAGVLEMRFLARANTEEATLFMRQADVKQEWRLRLNGKLLGKLFLMDEDLVNAIALPPGSLRDGENTLSILPPVTAPDDIVLHEMLLDPRPLRSAVSQATIKVQVLGTERQKLPARITLVDERGTLVPLMSEPADSVAARPGVVYSGSGAAQIGVRPGVYTLFASRGFEFGAASEKIEIKAGETKDVRMTLAREVATPGWVSCDTHIHTLTLSGHGDSTLDERMLTIAGEGIELAVATEHNRHTDYTEAATRMGVAGFFTPVRGNEVTTSRGHFNIFPINPGAPVPDAKTSDWKQLLPMLRAVPGTRLVLLNHPRGIHSHFRPFAPENFNPATGENPAGLDLSFNAMEIVNSGAQQSDYMLVVRDWFELLNSGYRIVGIGASDAHDVSRFIVGQARTYIAAPDHDPGKIDVDVACASLAAGKATISMGLLPQIMVEDRFTVGDLASGLPDQIRVIVKVMGPSWVKADRVELFGNGALLKETAIEGKRSDAAGLKAEVAWMIPRPATDMHLVVVASGPAVSAPFWNMPRPFQPLSRKWNGRSLGITNPVWLDADGDGKFTALRVQEP